MDLRERIASLMSQVRPEGPLALIHAPDESVDPAEIAAMALTEALFLERYAAIRS